MNQYKIRHGKEEDLLRIYDICNESKSRLKKLGISQWQSSYPSSRDWKKCLLDNELYVVYETNTSSNIISGVFCLSFKKEEMYEHIEEGSWDRIENNKNHDNQNDYEETSYIVLHRICVADEFLRTGVSSIIFDYSKKIMKEEHKHSIRIDTHEGNIPMKESLKKNKFIKCGKVYLLDGPEKGDLRIAYEYINNDY